MGDLGSEQDELYYFAKNFNKLKFSNEAYINSTEKQKTQNENEIAKLKNDYKKLTQDIATLKKECAYMPGRVKSASTSEYTFYRLKLDKAINEKLKSKEAWKKNSEKYNELKAEAKIISDENNPYYKRIKLLENKLDKAMIKYNEAMSIRRTYEQILTRLKEERAGYDNQIAAIQKSLKAKNHDLNEFKALLQDSKQARMYSDLLLKNTKLSKAAFEEHFEKLIDAHINENKKEQNNEKIEERKRRQKQTENQSFSEEKTKEKDDDELIEKVAKLEECDKMVRETTGADDINEICQKFSNLRETNENLINRQKELNKELEELKEKKNALSAQLNILKYSSNEEISRKEIEDHEKNSEKCLQDCEKLRQKYRKHDKLFIDIKSGIDTLITILSHKTFEDVIRKELKNDELNNRYKKLCKSSTQNPNIDLKELIEDLIYICSKIENHCSIIRHEHHLDEELNKLERKEENEIENIYIDQQVESNDDSEYGDDEDIDPEIQGKDVKRVDFDRNKRIVISAKNRY